jgi:hypothetical protein
MISRILGGRVLLSTRTQVLKIQNVEADVPVLISYGSNQLATEEPGTWSKEKRSLMRHLSLLILPSHLTLYYICIPCPYPTSHIESKQYI